jgi:hydrogenase nickel incorporation protein HypB
MCDTCGCSDNENGFKIIRSENFEDNSNLSNIYKTDSVGHSHVHGHGHSHGHEHTTSITINTPVLDKNNLLAERNRGWFEARNIKAYNLLSSPGSGKTTLLEKIILQIGTTHKIFVIEGDQQTTNDSRRIQKAGAKAIQINTGNGCHLDAEMINAALKELNPTENSIVFIENVGNLVCPALFDLGESNRILVASVTEGDDKPLKYSGIFESSQICIINKTDLLPYVDFDMKRFRENALLINHHLEFYETSATTQTGLDELLKKLFYD